MTDYQELCSHDVPTQSFRRHWLPGAKQEISLKKIIGVWVIICSAF